MNSIDSTRKSSKKKTRKNFEKNELSSTYIFSYNLLSSHLKFLFPKLLSLNTRMGKAGMRVPYEVFVCQAVFVSCLSGISGFVSGVIISLLFEISPWYVDIMLPIITAISFSQISFFVMIQYPAIQVNSRKRKIEIELPYFSGYLSTLSASGLTIEQSFKTIAKEDSQEELVNDAKILVRNLEVFGMDVIDAILDLIKKSPSESYTGFLEGLISSVESSGNQQKYFVSSSKVLMDEKKMSLRKMSASLGIIAEIYTILLIVFPLMGIIILSIMAIMSKNLMGMDLSGLMYLLTYLLVPIFGGMMLLIIDSFIPKKIAATTKSQFTNHKLSISQRIDTKKRIGIISGALGASIIATSFLIPEFFQSQNVMDVVILSGLLIGVIPYALFEQKASTKFGRIDENLPPFLHSLLSSVQSGSNLLKAIEHTSARDLGPLTSELKKLQSNIKLGMPIDKVFENFKNQISTILAVRVFTLLQVSLEMGGNVANTLDIIQKHITDTQNIEKERKSTLQSYVYVIYISFFVFIIVTVLLVSTFFAEISVMQEKLSDISENNAGMFSSILGIQVEQIKSIMFNMALIEAVFGGLAAGKISNGSFLAGIKHVLIMIALSVIIFSVI